MAYGMGPLRKYMKLVNLPQTPEFKKSGIRGKISAIRRVTSSETVSDNVAAHTSAKVILRESNNVSHAMPRTKDIFQDVRFGNEADLLQGVGIRYGDEYIPEGGRRWKKAFSRLDTKLRDAEYDTDKLFPYNHSLATLYKQNPRKLSVQQRRKAHELVVAGQSRDAAKAAVMDNYKYYLENQKGKV